MPRLSTSILAGRRTFNCNQPGLGKGMPRGDVKVSEGHPTGQQAAVQPKPAGVESCHPKLFLKFP